MLGHQQRTAGCGGSLEEEGDTHGLDERQHDRAVARVLGDLATTELALFGELLEVGPHHRQKLENDRGRNVGHNTQRKDRHPTQRAAREQVQKT